MNKIYTDEEYLAQGFEVKELGAIRMFDKLHNKKLAYGLSEKEENRYDALVKGLGL